MKKENLKKESYLPKIYDNIYGKRALAKALGIADNVSVALCALLYAAGLWLSFGRGIAEGTELLLTCAIPFVLVSAFRRIFNSPRPAEVLGLTDFPVKKKGHSFPSRHVFSAFCIGAALLPLYPTMGIAALILGAILSVLRVLLGVHFPRDVIAGAIIGVISAVIGRLIVNI